MYTLLYNSMVSWYRKYYARGAFAEWSAVLMLSLMAFLNIGSALALGAYFRWNVATRLIANGNPSKAALLAISLLVIHSRLFSKNRRAMPAPSDQSTVASSSKWPAGAYMFASVVFFLLASSLYSAHAPNQ